MTDPNPDELLQNIPQTTVAQTTKVRRVMDRYVPVEHRPELVRMLGLDDAPTVVNVRGTAVRTNYKKSRT